MGCTCMTFLVGRKNMYLNFRTYSYWDKEWNSQVIYTRFCPALTTEAYIYESFVGFSLELSSNVPDQDKFEIDFVDRTPFKIATFSPTERPRYDTCTYLQAFMTVLGRLESTFSHDLHEMTRVTLQNWLDLTWTRRFINVDGLVTRSEMFLSQFQVFQAHFNQLWRYGTSWDVFFPDWAHKGKLEKPYVCLFYFS